MLYLALLEFTTPPFLYLALLDSTTLYHGSTALYTMALLHTTWLYYILHWLQFNLLHSTVTLLGST